MNEKNFNLLVRDDFDFLTHLVQEGYFETSVFEEAVSRLSISLSMLCQSIQQNKEIEKWGVIQL